MGLNMIIDLVLVLIFALVIIHSARVGLARCLAGILAWIAATIIALNACTPAAEWVYVYIFQDRIVASLEENMRSIGDAEEVEVVAKAALEQLPDVVVKAAESIGIDVNDLVNKSANVEVAENNVALAIERDVFAPLCTAALKAILFLVILIVLTVVVRLILSPVCKLISKTPIVGKTDHALGGVLGILKGAMMIMVLAILTSVAANIVEGPLAQAVEQSKLIPVLVQSPLIHGFFE